MDPTGIIAPTLRIQPLTPYHQGGGRQSPPLFTQGQVLQGTVSGRAGHNQFTIDIGGRQVLADATAPLQVGQKLDLQVTTLSPQVELQILKSDPVNRMIGNAIHLVGQQSDTLAALTTLADKATQLPQLSASAKQTLQFYGSTQATTTPAATPPGSPDLDGARLEQVLTRLGTNMERLLAGNQTDKAGQTLKHALLELLPQLPTTDNSHEQAEQIVKSIELFQLLQIRLANESLFFLPLPLAFLNQGYLLVDSDQGSGEEDQPGGATAQRYELHLQLEGLGNLQVDLLRDGGGVAIKFLAEDPERAKFLAGFRQELGQWLTAIDLESVQFLVGAREPAKTLLAQIMGGATGMVDTRA